MLVAELIRTDRALIDTQTVDDALAYLHQVSQSEWPVVNGSGLPVGIAVEHQLLTHDGQKRLHDVMEPETLALSLDMHVFDAVRKMNHLKRETIAVVDDTAAYVGTLVRAKMISSLTSVLHLDESGSVVTVELKERDYELTVLVRLIEQEGARILTISVEAPDEHFPLYRISFKLNLVDVGRISSTLRRHGFTVSTESRSEEHEAEWADRADAFLRYLDM